MGVATDSKGRTTNEPFMPVRACSRCSKCSFRQRTLPSTSCGAECTCIVYSVHGATLRNGVQLCSDALCSAAGAGMVSVRVRVQCILHLRRPRWAALLYSCRHAVTQPHMRVCPLRRVPVHVYVYVWLANGPANGCMMTGPHQRAVHNGRPGLRPAVCDWQLWLHRLGYGLLHHTTRCLAPHLRPCTHVHA